MSGRLSERLSEDLEGLAVKLGISRRDFNTTETLVRITGHPQALFADIETILRSFSLIEVGEVSSRAIAMLPKFSEETDMNSLDFGFRYKELLCILKVLEIKKYRGDITNELFLRLSIIVDDQIDLIYRRRRLRLVRWLLGED